MLKSHIVYSKLRLRGFFTLVAFVAMALQMLAYTSHLAVTSAAPLTEDYRELQALGLLEICTYDNGTERLSDNQPINGTNDCPVCYLVNTTGACENFATSHTITIHVGAYSALHSSRTSLPHHFTFLVGREARAPPHKVLLS